LSSEDNYSTFLQFDLRIGGIQRNGH